MLFMLIFLLAGLLYIEKTRDVKLEYKILKEKIKEYNKKDAKFYGQMFAKLNKLEPFETIVSFKPNLLYNYYVSKYYYHRFLIVCLL